jgi:hypothetical protein
MLRIDHSGFVARSHSSPTNLVLLDLFAPLHRYLHAANLRYVALPFYKIIVPHHVDAIGYVRAYIYATPEA